jgi:hypothetical protein
MIGTEGDNMIEQIEHKLHPFNTFGETDRYYVVFWTDGDEMQALVRTTEKDVAEVHAWATREAQDMGADCFQLHAVVPDAEGDWPVLLTGPPIGGDIAEDEQPKRELLGPLTNWLARWRYRRAEARGDYDTFANFVTQSGARFTVTELDHDHPNMPAEGDFIVRVWDADPGAKVPVVYRGFSDEGGVRAINVVDALEFADAATRHEDMQPSGKTAEVGVLAHEATSVDDTWGIIWIWGENPLS